MHCQGIAGTGRPGSGLDGLDWRDHCIGETTGPAEGGARTGGGRWTDNRRWTLGGQWTADAGRAADWERIVAVGRHGQLTRSMDTVGR
jgi:hypothetical protein